jgi:formylglycine-generating enzyme required for sulfatase activity
MAEADDPSTAVPAAGAQILSVGGGYRLLQPLGRGAFGEVWKAEAPGGVEVAVKLITRSVKAAEAQRELAALQLMKRLRHQNLLALQAFFPLPDRLIIVLELADGSLRGRLEECQAAGPPGIPPAELLRYFREAAEALDYLHEQNVQHRDVKPDNLLLLGAHVKVADFGLAKLLEQTQLQTASHAGTPAYMAPEVWDSKLSVHSDQYSLAVAYVQLRTGRFPFAADSLAALMKAHLMSAPDLGPLGPHEQEVLRRALAKDPDARYPSCTAFVKALVTALMAEREAADRPAPPPGHKRPAAPAPSSPATQTQTARATLTPLPTPPISASATQPVRRVRPAADRPWLILLVTLGAFALVAGLIVGGLLLGRPRDTGTGPAQAAGSAKPATQPEQKRQPVPTKVPEPKPAPPADLAKEITNSLGMRLVLIPAGQFTMGSPWSEASRDENEARHEVEITRPFYLGTLEVTQAQYRAVMGENPSWFCAAGGGKDRVRGLDTDAFPVERVSWADAVRFCERLSARAEEKGAGRTYRLPTEAEWEYACREGGTSSTAFHYGNSLSSTQANFDGGFPYAAAPSRYLQRTARVGSYQPNRLGLFDLHGNVWEWCQDWYDKDYYRTSPRQDPQGPPAGSVRVLRGGSWVSSGQSCRSAVRGFYMPDNRHYNIGLRVAAVPAGTR